MSSELGSRAVFSDPRELWYLALPNKMTPKQVLQILRAALAGDIWQQWQLLSLMLDTWPMLRKCSHEVRGAVAGARYMVKAYGEEGMEPSDSAKERADLVGRAIRLMKPDPFSDEKGFYGTLYDITDGMLNGISMSELLWTRTNKGELMPRASAWVHPRHYVFTQDGRIAVYTNNYARVYTGTPAATNTPGPDPNKFLCSQFVSRTGSSLGAGLMRPLAWYWSSVVFNREWMLNFAQKYGNPFLDATYKPGTPAAEITKLEEFMAEAGSQGWLLHVEGSEVKVNPAQSLGADNAQVKLMSQADEACQILLLGQTATTQGTPGKLGGEDAHESVKREIVQGVARWVSTVLSEQLASAILRVNYGDEEECPTIVPDFTGEGDPMKEASRDSVFLSSGVPMDAEEFYERHNMKMPEQGDKVVVNGKLGILGSTDEEVAGGKPEPVMPFGPGQPFGTGDGTKLQADEKDLPQTKPVGEEEEEEAEEEEQEDPVEAVRSVLRVATGDELGTLKALVVKAKEAPHANGEWEAVKIHINSIRNRRINREQAN